MYQVFFGENFITSASLFHNKKIKIYYYLSTKLLRKALFLRYFKFL